MPTEMQWSPALKLIRSFSPSRRSQNVGNPKSWPNGGCAGLKPRQFEDFLAAQKAELAPVPLAANPAAVEPAIGG